MQWSIGFSKGSINEIITEKHTILSFKWLPLKNNIHSFADPFFFRDNEGNLKLLYEDFSMVKPSIYGKIGLATLDKNFNIIDNKEVLDTKSHSSYPFIFFDNEVTYVIPETSVENNVAAYEYNFTSKCLVNKRILVNDLPLLDSTILKHDGKYWLFATLAENGNDHSMLNIYYADSLFGSYKPHLNNPVKNNLDGSRPAGNFITVNGELYRPAQNCSQHYGESITINKIIRLSETEFLEEFYLKILPDMSSEFNAGVHTINIVDDIIVVDGIKMVFSPITKWILFFRKKIKKISN